MDLRFLSVLRRTLQTLWVTVYIHETTGFKSAEDPIAAWKAYFSDRLVSEHVRLTSTILHPS
ncbi:MAG TPA: hypothetical protein VFE27_04065 [Acidobacteriaceae bacterium]|jgi:hypothetical protein|nr:hypothetical protein [Acidobacteriaceae bacterium]